jgi:hypothetical protein
MKPVSDVAAQIRRGQVAGVAASHVDRRRRKCRRIPVPDSAITRRQGPDGWPNDELSWPATTKWRQVVGLQ